MRQDLLASQRDQPHYPPRSGRRSRHARPRRRLTWVLVPLAALVAAGGGYVLTGHDTVLAGHPGRPRPAASPRVTLGPVSWPAHGAAAADVSGLGVVAGPGARRVVPIASVAKVMTAYVILRDHPLSRGGAGPVIVVQALEAADYQQEASAGDSLVRVEAGERITERQALEALLLPSADNMAWILARWDAGSEAAFVARMNSTARRLGMTSTRYTDPSGLAASTVSTAADQVRLGTAAMGEPSLAALVAMRAAVIPVAGPVRNYNTLLGRDGVAGIKTGGTRAAGGCVLLAARRRAGSHPVLIVAAVLGQPGTPQTMLPAALRAAGALLVSLRGSLRSGSGQHRPRQRSRRPR